MIRRLIPGRDIYRVESILTAEGRRNLWSQWGVFRYSHGVKSGFLVSEHPTRDQARAAKIKHEEAYDRALTAVRLRGIQRGKDLP